MTPDQPDAASAPTEPSFAERARTLLHLGRVATLSTLSRHLPGHPFGSLTPYGLDRGGRPTLLISRLALHAQNLAADPRASLLVAEADGADDAQARARVTVVGAVAPIEGAALAEVREDYLARHPSARTWVDFGDFAFHRLEVAGVYYVAGFGAMGWIEPAEYGRAEADPLADGAAAILAHMNADHADALLLYCRTYAGVEAETAVMTGVDRLGLRVRATAGERVHDLRIAYPREARSAMECRKVLVEMVRTAR